MILPATSAKTVAIKQNPFFSRNPDLAGLMMDTIFFSILAILAKVIRV